MQNHTALSKARIEALADSEGTAGEHTEKGVNFLEGHQKTFALYCKWCGSDNVVKLRGEIAMRLPGLKNIDMPIVHLFPEIVACLDCAVAQFVIPETELHLLAKRGAAAG